MNEMIRRDHSDGSNLLQFPVRPSEGSATLLCPRQKQRASKPLLLRLLQGIRAKGAESELSLETHFEDN